MQIPSGSVPLDPESRVWIEGHERREPSTPERSNASTISCSELPTARSAATPLPRDRRRRADDSCRQAADDAVVAVTRARRLPRRQPIHDLGVRVRNLRGLDEVQDTAGVEAVSRPPTTTTWDRLAIGVQPLHRRTSSRLRALRALRRAVSEEPTPRQREVFIAVALKDVQMDVVAEQLHLIRGAVYKVLHDARKKPGPRLEREGHPEREERT